MDKEESETKRVNPNPVFEQPTSELTSKQLGQLFLFGSEEERAAAERVATERKSKDFIHVLNKKMEVNVDVKLNDLDEFVNNLEKTVQIFFILNCNSL